MTKQEVINRLKNHRYKLTPQREILIDVFLNTEGYVSAKDVYQKVKTMFPQISLDTIYRNLQLLCDIHVLNSTSIGNNTLYEMKKQLHTHALKCIKCGHSFELDICPLDYCLNHLDEFKVLDHKLEIYGICKTCQNCKESRGIDR